MDQMTELLMQYGLWLVFANVLLTQLGLPLPALPMLIIAGTLGHDGQLSLVSVMLAAIAGSLMGDCIWYVAGRMAGHRVLRVLCHLSVEPDSCAQQIETTFNRWGATSLLFAKFIPGFSTVAPPIVGVVRLRWPVFLILSAVGAALWAGAAIALGMIFQTQVDSLIHWLSEKGALAILIASLVIGLYLLFKWVERHLFMRAIRIAHITVDELRALRQENASVTILDVRSPLARKVDPRHIPGAIAIDITAPERFVADVTPDHHVVVYCTCPNEARVARIVRQLMRKGIHKIRPLAGGLAAWIKVGGEFAVFEVAD
jgi:membrane protein DedA with SNARE-associated domain/rhodanese-related sulfurtransferase